MDVRMDDGETYIKHGFGGEFADHEHEAETLEEARDFCNYNHALIMSKWGWAGYEHKPTTK